MTEEENQNDDWEERWNGFLGTGKFDELQHPDHGYELGDYVVGRDGIGYKVKGLGPKGKVILDGGKLGEKTVSKGFVRFGGDVHGAFVQTGVVKISQDKGIELKPPTSWEGKNSQFN